MGKYNTNRRFVIYSLHQYCYTIHFVEFNGKLLSISCRERAAFINTSFFFLFVKNINSTILCYNLV